MLEGRGDNPTPSEDAFEGGRKSRPRRLLIRMTDHISPSKPGDALDELTDQLLECGAALSQIVGHMIKSQASGQSTPDAAPIPEVAHGLIRSVLEDLADRHSDGQIEAAARIVQEATYEICENIFFVPVEQTEPGANGRRRGRNGSRPRRPR